MPVYVDSDGDGHSDEIEYRYGTDPTRASSYPTASSQPITLPGDDPNQPYEDEELIITTLIKMVEADYSENQDTGSSTITGTSTFTTWPGNHITTHNGRKLASSFGSLLASKTYGSEWGAIADNQPLSASTYFNSNSTLRYGDGEKLKPRLKANRILKSDEHVVRTFIKVVDEKADGGSGWTVLSVGVAQLDVKPGKSQSAQVDENGNELDPVVQNAKTRRERLLPAMLSMDLDNDGKIDAQDESLRDAAYKSSATDEEKDNGTEFLFHNDQLSNGLWDKEDSDPDKPANAKIDDDAQEIQLVPGITEGEVWLEHPAIAGLSFFKTRECNPADKVNLSSSQKFIISDSNPFPQTLFVRADGTINFPAANPQIEGDLTLKMKVAGVETEALKMKLTIVKELAATKYFFAARDYISENNTKTFTHDKKYGANIHYRIVAMREETTTMSAIDTYDHVASAPKQKGINAVRDAYNSSDVIVNGNQCFFSSGGWWNNVMTDRCDGRLCVGRTVLRPPSDDTHHPLGSVQYGRWAGYTSIDGINGFFDFKAGQVPESNPSTPDHGMGGFSTNYTLAVRQTAENQLIGYAPMHESQKGVIFTATNFPGKGGKAKEFSEDAKKSGVPLLPGGDSDDLKLLHLDGSTSVGLCLRNPSQGLKTVLKGSKHDGGTVSYYINTYLLFECEPPRE